MKTFYLVLAVIGTVAPYVFFFDFVAEHGLSLPAFLAGAFANGAAGGLVADLLISSAVFWVWLAAERAEHIWAYVALNLLIGLSCALPVYLYVRARRAERVSASDPHASPGMPGRAVG